MPLFVPRIVGNLDDPRQKLLIQNFMKELLDMSFRLTFLNKDGGVGGGTRSYNFDGVWVAYVSNGTANTEDTVSHNLGRTPVGFFTGMPDKSAVIYADNQSAWTSTTVRLKASAVTVTVNLWFF